MSLVGRVEKERGGGPDVPFLELFSMKERTILSKAPREYYCRVCPY